jgi:Protein of unknown function (DUF1360)
MISELGFWPRFVLAVLATWRISHLLAKEDGSADFIVRIRDHLGDGFLGKLMDCVYCLSLWVAAPMAFYVSQRPLDLLLTWLAISGAACLLERIGQEPVVIEPTTLPEEGGVGHGMLRSETSGTQQHAVADDGADRHATRTEY